MRRVRELDGLRGLAAVAIVLYHGQTWTGIRRIDLVLSHGWIAVDFFFLLSGFLITSILLHGRPSWDFLRSFYARRTLRIWPLYYFALFGLVVIGLLAPTILPGPSARQFAVVATFTFELPIWVPPAEPYTPLGHFWSLAVEEQFYLIWPAVVLLGGRRAVVLGSVALLALGIGSRVGLQDTRHVLIGRCDGLAYGALLAAIAGVVQDREARSRSALAFAATAVASLVGLAAWYRLDASSLFHRENILLLACPLFFGIVGFVVCAEGGTLTAPLRARWLVYLGTISYGIYVYHWIIIMAVDRCFGYPSGDGRAASGRAGLLLLILELAIILVVAALSWRYLENPFLRLKSRFDYRAADRRPGQAPARPAFDPVLPGHLVLPQPELEG